MGQKASKSKKADSRKGARPRTLAPLRDESSGSISRSGSGSLESDIKSKDVRERFNLAKEQGFAGAIEGVKATLNS
jgi:hypothetical protein